MKTGKIAFVVMLALFPVKSLTALDAKCGDPKKGTFESSRIHLADPIILPGMQTRTTEVCLAMVTQACRDIGRGSCGGYNKDTKANCGPCSRPTTYQCDDGTYREYCTPDPQGCGSNCH